MRNYILYRKKGLVWKKSLALISALALVFTLFLPAAGWAQFKTLPVPPAPGKGYDAARQADAMVKRHDVAPVLDSSLIEKLKSVKEGEFVPVIIHMRDKADLKKLKVRFNKQNFSPAALEQHKKAVIDELKTHAQNTQAPVLTVLEEYQAKGKAKEIRSFWLFNGITAKVGKEVIYELARNPRVEKIVYDDIKFTPVAAPVEGKGGPVAGVSEMVYGVSETVYGSEKAAEPAVEPAPPAAQPAAPAPQQSVTWGLAKIGADQVWSEYNYDGTGVVVGHLDTGVDPRHRDLLIDPNGDPDNLDNWKLVGWAEFDYLGNMISNDRQYAYDDHGHGTHTAGTMVGDAYSGTHIGVAPGARLVSGKVLTYGSGTFAQVVAGMEWIVTVPGVRVVNMSLGATGAYSEMIEPTRNMVEMFVFPSFSIGNSGPNSSGSPGNVPAACGVGATDEYDNVASWSSGEWVEWDCDPYHGKYLKPDVAAPGVGVYSSLPGNNYASWSGTSMAAPHVSGAVALILQAQPWLSVEEVRSLLKQTAVDLGTAGPDIRYGWGRINVKAAVDLLQRAGFVSGSITGPDAEAVEADVSVDGKWLAKADPVYGSYDLALDSGGRSLTVSHPLYRDGTATVNVVTGEYTEQNFSLTKKSLGSFGGTVRDPAGTPVPDAVVELEGVRGAVTKTDSLGRYRLDNIPEGTYKMRMSPPLPYGIQRVDATIPATGGLVMQDFTVNTADILLVDHDYWDTWETYYLEALSQKGYSVAYWDWDAALDADYYDNWSIDTNCLPPLEVLKQFSKIVLADFDGYVIWLDDEYNGTRALRQYLDTGRKMFVSGEDIGYMSGWGYYREFYRNYLHAKYLADVGSWLVRGVPADGWPRGIFEGVDMDIDFGGDGANNQWWPDVVAPADEQAVSVADYVDPDVAGSGALAVDGPLHRLMYFSFGFEGINGADSRADVMDRVMKFLDSPTENTRETISYSSAWGVANDANATDGRYRVSSAANATATFTFTGDNITWITAKGPAYGKAEVLIDGASKGVVDLYNATQVWQHQQSYTGLAAGSHTITVKVLRQKNSSSSGYDVVVDAFAVKLDDRDPAVSYSGTWAQASNSNAYKNTISYSDQTNASCTITFEGQGITWYSSKGPYRGIARLYLDGANKGTVDLYATSYVYNVPVKTFTGLASGQHQLKIVVTGTKNPSSTGIRIVNDAHAVLTEDNSPQVVYSSSWLRANTAQASGGNFHYSDSGNSEASYVFAGTSVTWLTSKGPVRGIARVYIDGVDQGTVDLYAPNYSYKVPVNYTGLFYGLHVIKIVNTGTKNASSSGYRVVVDAFGRGLNE